MLSNEKFDNILEILGLPHTKESPWYKDKLLKISSVLSPKTKRYFFVSFIFTYLNAVGENHSGIGNASFEYDGFPSNKGMKMACKRCQQAYHDSLDIDGCVILSINITNYIEMTENDYLAFNS